MGWGRGVGGAAFCPSAHLTEQAWWAEGLTEFPLMLGHSVGSRGQEVPSSPGERICISPDVTLQSHATPPGALVPMSGRMAGVWGAARRLFPRDLLLVQGLCCRIRGPVTGVRCLRSAESDSTWLGRRSSPSRS